MATEIRLRNPKTGDEQVGYEGYSWTSLCFGAFPTLLRGDIALGLAVLFVIVVLGIISRGLSDMAQLGSCRRHLGLILQ
jgi:hypothetical protein